jgi:hypothetical protein
MKKIMIFGLFLLTIILVGCNENITIQCNEPYLLVGNECCLDKDSNNICDIDEEVKSEKMDHDQFIEEEIEIFGKYNIKNFWLSHKNAGIMGYIIGNYPSKIYIVNGMISCTEMDAEQCESKILQDNKLLLVTDYDYRHDINVQDMGSIGTKSIFYRMEDDNKSITQAVLEVNIKEKYLKK